MEKIIHYPVADKKENGIQNDHFRLIPIQNILFDQGMTKKVNEVCGDIAKKVGIKLLKRDQLPLLKWDKVLKDIKNKTPLDPITVERFKKTDYYEVIQGRHRVVASLHENYTHVPVILIKNLIVI